MIFGCIGLRAQNRFHMNKMSKSNLIGTVCAMFL